MARKVNRKELCEAIRQGQARMKERMDGPVSPEPKPEPVRMQFRQPKPRVERRPRKPLIPASVRQFRVKVNPKYLAAAAAGLFFMAGVIWLGNAIGRQDGSVPPAGPDTENPAEILMRPSTPPANERETELVRTNPPRDRTPVRPSNPVLPTNPPAAVQQGDHVVVIATFTKREPLEPVMAHFNANGIPADVIQRGSYYMVVTKNRFEASQRTSPAGRQMLQRISEIGAQYKAPAGMPGFSQATFDSAYFRKL